MKSTNKDNNKSDSLIEERLQDRANDEGNINSQNAVDLSSQQEYIVERGDTLWGVAKLLRPEGLSISDTVDEYTLITLMPF